MVPEIKHYPVNWVDGMKISRKHFTELNEFIQEHLRDSSALGLTAHNYGLLPSDPYGLSSLEVHLTVDQNQGVQVRLITCRAITAGGCRIEILDSNKLLYHTSLTELLADFNLTPTNQLGFSVAVSVNPLVRVPMGSPAPEERPPRHPYTMPEYSVSVVPSQQVNSADFSSFHLVIGELVYQEGQLRNVADYIPPCSSMMSHPGLLKWLNQFDSLLHAVEADSFRIVNKIRARQDKRSTLSELVNFVVERMVLALSNHLTTLRFTAAQQPPIVLLDSLMRLAKQFKSILDCLTPPEREELLNYLEQWSEIPPVALLGALNNGVSLTYDHSQTAKHFHQLHELWQLIATIFRQLSQLEYIGKTKEGWKTFINENPLEATPERIDNRWKPF